MKKFLIALALGLVLVLALASVASADNGPHGGFNGSTNACSSCHRAHSAISADGFLLVANNVYELCSSCHDGTGAFTNVVDGYYDTQVGDPGKAAWLALATASPNGQWGDSMIGLFGGGFENTRMLTDYGNAANEGGLALATNNVAADQNLSLTSWARMNAYDTASAAPAARAITSRHDVEGAPAVTDNTGVVHALGTGAGTIWGSGTYNSVNDAFTGAAGDALECTSCHDPHGNGGRNAAGQPYPSYRILRYTPSGSNGFEIATGTTAYWDTDVNWAAVAGYAGKYALQSPIVPSGAGVLVPDTPTYWYSVNNDYALDGTLLARRGRQGSGEIFVANFAGQGDYGGRYYMYKRPSATVTAATTGTIISCGATPTVPGTACGATTGDTFNNLPPHDVLGFWCSTCHDRYLAPGGASRTTDSGDADYHYRHRAQGLSNTGMGTGQYTCVDCHNAHGTSATADAQAGFASYAGAASATGSSVLLKGDNRAICVRCHAGAVNFFNVVTSPTAPMVLP